MKQGAIETGRRARKEKFAELHARVARNFRAGNGVAGEMSRDLAAIARERLWAAGGYTSWGDYVKRGVGMSLARANDLRRVSVFARADVSEHGCDKLVLVLRIWESTGRRVDPARLRDYRFTVSAGGRRTSMCIGDPMTIADLENALGLALGQEPAPPIPAGLARTLEEIEERMAGADFRATARPRAGARGPRVVLAMDPPDMLRAAVAVVDALGYACALTRKDADAGGAGERPGRAAVERSAVAETEVRREAGRAERAPFPAGDETPGATTFEPDGGGARRAAAAGPETDGGGGRERASTAERGEPLPPRRPSSSSEWESREAAEAAKRAGPRARTRREQEGDRTGRGSTLPAGHRQPPVTSGRGRRPETTRRPAGGPVAGGDGRRNRRGRRGW